MMATNITKNYQEILSKHPLFAGLTPEALDQLSQLFTSCSYAAGDIIVSEKKLVDSIYFIISGHAEVSKIIIINGQQESQPVASLKENESIGINESGLFSPHGKRSATVTALSPLQAIRLDITQFRDFMQSHPLRDEQLLKSLKMLARMNFIKQLLPFSELSVDRLYSVSEQIKEIDLLANTILFHQGDIGDACYLLESGQADVIVKSSLGEYITIAEVTPPNIIGEAALLTDAPRNATIKITSDARLLIIEKTLFAELTQTETSTANALMRLQHSRYRPIQLQGVENFESITSDGEKIITLRNSQESKYYQMSEDGFFIWQTLNGNNALMDITYLYYEKYQIFAPEMITKFIVDLSLSGFAQLDASVKNVKSNVKLPLMLRAALSIAKIMEFRHAFGNADTWITASYQKLIWILYTKPFQLFGFALTLIGFISFVLFFPHAALELNVAPNKWQLFFLAVISTLFTVPIHELSHAYTTKHYGRRVHCFGLGWFWIGPFAFCDTSDMWLCSRYQRIIVDLIGLYVNLMLAGISGIMMFIFQGNQDLFIYFGLFSLLNYLVVISNLYPGIELDGYYALMDAFDKPNLRLSAIEWFVKKMNEKHQGKPVFLAISKDFKHHYPEISYWLISIGYILFIQTIVSYLVLHYLLYGLLSYRNRYVNMTIILIAIILSSLKLYGEVVKKRKSAERLKIKL